MTSNATNAPKEPFVQSRPFGYLVQGVFSLLAVLLGYWLATRSAQPEIYVLAVSPTEYPLASTNIQLNPGDSFEIRVLEANNIFWDCRVGRTSPIGMVDHDYQINATHPGAYFCALIGRIGDGPYFAVGAYHTSVSEVTGKLQLGVNDVPPEACFNDPPESCYTDNLGTLTVKITVNRG